MGKQKQAAQTLLIVPIDDKNVHPKVCKGRRLERVKRINKRKRKKFIKSVDFI